MNADQDRLPPAPLLTICTAYGSELARWVAVYAQGQSTQHKATPWSRGEPGRRGVGVARPRRVLATST